jgi:hypothetical protein
MNKVHSRKHALIFVAGNGLMKPGYVENIPVQILPREVYLSDDYRLRLREEIDLGG